MVADLWRGWQPKRTSLFKDRAVEPLPAKKAADGKCGPNASCMNSYIVSHTYLAGAWTGAQELGVPKFPSK